MCWNAVDQRPQQITGNIALHKEDPFKYTYKS